MIYFIVNPAAGNGRGEAAANRAGKLLNEKGIDYRILFTKEPYHAAELTRKAIGEGAKTIVAVGGDGTLLEAAQGFMDGNENIAPHINFGIIPVGSGNDFIKSLHIPKDIDGAVEVILRGRSKKTDILKYNGGYCLNIGCIGIDSEIAYLASKTKNIWGKFSYIVSVLRNIFTYKCIRAKIKIDGMTLEQKFTLIAVCNGKYYGGGFKITPMSQVNDGYITLCYVDALMFLKILLIFPLVAFGMHKDLKIVHFKNCKELTLEFDREYKFNIDGNVIYTDGKVKFEVIKEALNIIC